ncbi:MAG: phosphopantetheine-binding protein [bacterium]
MELQEKIKEFIIHTLRLDITPEEIGDDTPLFGESGLGLDSIDALELIVNLEKKFHIKITDNIQGEKILSSVSTITEFVTSTGKEIPIG